MSVLAQVFAASTLAGLVSMVIAFFYTARLNKVWLMRMVSFAAGLMLAIALLDLLPEALEQGISAKNLFTVLLASLIVLFAIDYKLHGAHRHGLDGACAHELARPIPMILLGGALHVFTDGLLLGAAFLVDTTLGWGMAFAILLHEIPREAGDFALLLTARWPHSRALMWNAIGRLACVAGAVAGYLILSDTRQWLPVVLAIAAGNFIYIALTGILPWLRNERQAFAWQGGLMVAGALCVGIGQGLLH